MKSALLFSFLLWGTAFAKVVSSDRYLLRVVDRTISYQDIEFQLRNLNALDCVYGDSLVVSYFKKPFLTTLSKFVSEMPKDDAGVVKFLHEREPVLLNVRYLFKMLRYAEDQKAQVSDELSKLIRESAKENRCGTSVLYKDTLKTNFIALMELEIYLRSRYGNQMKTSGNSFESIRPSIELFIESLDKQFTHEYYW